MLNLVPEVRHCEYFEAVTRHSSVNFSGKSTWWLLDLMGL